MFRVWGSPRAYARSKKSAFRSRLCSAVAGAIAGSPRFALCNRPKRRVLPGVARRA